MNFLSWERHGVREDKPQNRKKIFIKHIFDKRLVSKTYEGLLKFNKKTTQLKKWTKDVDKDPT